MSMPLAEGTPATDNAARLELLGLIADLEETQPGSYCPDID
jgi:hypothetical protein